MFVRFNSFVYDVDRAELRDGGQVIKTRPQERAFLRKLLFENGRIVPDAAMQAELSTRTSDIAPNLAVLASRLNKAFKQNGATSDLIIREKKVGYRVASRIEKVDQDFADVNPPKGSTGPVEYSRPMVTHITGTDEPGHLKLLQESFGCYEELFPEAERDPNEAIEIWLESNGRDQNLPWRDVWSVLHGQDGLIGISFLTGNPDFSFLIGNYFGVKADYRQDRYAVYFLNKVVERAREIVPTAKGILFEVDCVNFELMQALARAFKQAAERDKTLKSDREAFFKWLEEAWKTVTNGSSGPEGLDQQLRSLRRLWLYDSYEAQILLDGGGRPVKYWQPAIEAEKVELHLMLKLFAEQTSDCVDLDEIAEFIYDEFYGGAYADENSNASIDGFDRGLQEVKQDFLNQIHQNCRFGKTPDVRNVINIVSRLKLFAPERIAL